MSRDGIDNCAPILAAAARWKDGALQNDDSIFTAGSLWTLEHFKGLERYFVLNLDEGEGTFIGKLERQLAPAPAAVKQLAAELSWVMLLCPSNTRPPRKRETIEQIWAWSGQSIPAGAKPWFTDDVLDGLGSAGPGYNNHRWRELVFAVRFGLAFKVLSNDERARLLSDGWVFAEWLEQLPEVRERQFRHMLLYLLFPDTFERIFGGGERRLIVQGYRGLSPLQVRRLSPIQVDHELEKIRGEEQALNPDAKLDFYIEPLRSKWKVSGFAEFTADIEKEHILKAIEEIDQRGVPASAESTIYDLVYIAKRYPPKLVLSLAAKHASGKEFDRSLFSGGIGSSAFQLLRGLGFSIERKDLVPELLRKFLAQASAGDSTAVKGYASSFRGLAIQVSFGKGSVAFVPWIAFLGPEQEVQHGIYPLYLYYKSAGILVLAKGVSESNPPSLLWSQNQSNKTVDQFFIETTGRRAEKYPESLVYRTYRIPLEISDTQLNEDLDSLINEYQDLLGNVSPPTTTSMTAASAPNVASAVREPDPIEPYTITEATEALFIPQERFEEILTIWRHKKNLVVQGPPGVGKTFFYRQLAYALMQEKAPNRIAKVEFHPSYSYEDFVQGYRPEQGGFSLKDGLFLRFCEKARKDSTNYYVFVIDEINRGNLAKIFGELLMLLEADKRSEEWGVPLVYSQDEALTFFVPKNLYFLGLMNTADRSLAVVDYALRRRFAFVHLEPAFSSPRFTEYLMEKGVADTLVAHIVNRMRSLNAEIAQDKTNLGPGFCIGHSFFCDPPEEAERHSDWYMQVVASEIAPLLEQYYFDDPERASKLIKQLQVAG